MKRKTELKERTEKGYGKDVCKTGGFNGNYNIESQYRVTTFLR